MPRPDLDQPWAVLDLLLFAGSLLALYFVVRTAVHHGILDAEETRQGRVRDERLEQTLRKGRYPDAPTR